MLRNLKKMLALLVALQMLFSCMPVTALAEQKKVETQSGGQLLFGTKHANEQAHTIKVGEKLPLTASDELDWSRSDAAVAIVSTKNGNKSKKATVTGIAPGVAEIYAKDDDEIEKTYVITVVAPVDPTGVSISGENEMVAYTTMQLSAMYAPEGAAPASVTWKSSNDEVLKVDSTGLVTAMKPGTAFITVTATDQKGNDISSEPHKIVVSRATTHTHPADFYYLKTPTSDPKSNNPNQ